MTSNRMDATVWNIKAMNDTSSCVAHSDSHDLQRSLSETLKEVRMIRETIDELKKINHVLVNELRAMRRSMHETLPVKLGHTITECLLNPSSRDCYVVVPQSRPESFGSEDAFDALYDDSISMSTKTVDAETKQIRDMLGLKYTPEVDLNVWLRKG